MRWHRSWHATAVALAISTVAAHAMFISVNLENVPVDRLIANLEAAVKEHSADQQLAYNLARAHAMAYASSATTVPVLPGHPESGPVLRTSDNRVVPYQVTSRPDPAAQSAARAHLDRAIKLLTTVVATDQHDVRARLTLGWCEQQAGNTPVAIAEYRIVIDMAWAIDKVSTGMPVGKEMGSDPHLPSLYEGHLPVTAEAISYLTPLLDPDKDRAELAALQEKLGALARLPRWITPIAIPLADGLEPSDLEARDARVLFDADGSGLARRWSWITPRAGWLVYEQTGRGVTSALQMFGNVTFWMFWRNGYEALSSLDDNRDGEISGPELAHLMIWRDVSSNGRVEPGELQAVSRWGIVALSCRYEFDARHPDEIAFSRAGLRLRDGHTRPTYDVILHAR